MGAHSKRKGYAFEAATRGYMQERGWHVTRHYQRAANNDTPDLTCSLEHEHSISTPRVVLRVECKNRKTMPAKCDADALDQALASSGPGVAVACVKRPGKPVADSVVMLRLEDFLKLVEG